MNLTMTWYWRKMVRNSYIADDFELEDYEGPIPRVGDTLFRVDCRFDIEKRFGVEEPEWVVEEVVWQMTESLVWQVYVRAYPKKED